MTKLDRLHDADLPCPPALAPGLRSWFERWSAELAAEDP